MVKRAFGKAALKPSTVLADVVDAGSRFQSGMGTITLKCNRLLIDYMAYFCVIDY